MKSMNKYIQSKVKNKKFIFIALTGILIIGITGLLIFNATDHSSAKSGSKESNVSKISNVSKEKDKKNEEKDSKGTIEEKNKDSDEDTSDISKNSLNVSKKSNDSVNSDKKSDDENKNNSQKSTKSNAGTNNSTQKNNSYNSNNSDKSNASNKSDSSNSTNNNSGGSVSKPSHEHVYNIPVTQKIHHDAVTKTETVTVVDQQAYDEPIYESHQICKVCGKDFGKGENATVEAINHSVETGHSYHSTSIKIGTKHHDAITHQETKTIVVTPAYDEEKVTGYRCSCGKTK
jgi:DNA mismatch repair ATPase MutL